jgi:hypothetical protein
MVSNFDVHLGRNNGAGGERSTWREGEVEKRWSATLM